MAEDILGKLGVPKGAAGVPPVVAPQNSPLPAPAAATDAEANFQKIRDEALANLGAPRNVRAELLQQAHPLPSFPLPPAELSGGLELPGISPETAAWLAQPNNVRNIRTERLREGSPQQAAGPDQTFGMGPSFYRLTEEQQGKVRAAYEAMVAARAPHEQTATLQ